MPFDLTSFGLSEMLRCGRILREEASGASSIRDVAEATVAALRRECVDPATGRPACALVRFYKTHPFGTLPAEEQEFARALLRPPARPHAGTKCLTLLATAGDEPPWNSPQESRAHRAIPLASAGMVAKAPMIAALLHQLGVDVETLIAAGPAMSTELTGKTYNVFHVAEARGSPVIPAQDDFVVPYAVRSVLGFGGLLRTGDLFAVIMFARVPIPHDTASRFRNIALEVKTSIYRVSDDRVFS